MVPSKGTVFRHKKAGADIKNNYKNKKQHTIDQKGDIRNCKNGQIGQISYFRVRKFRVPVLTTDNRAPQSAPFRVFVEWRGGGKRRSDAS
jgi:hypothetical protein